MYMICCLREELKWLPYEEGAWDNFDELDVKNKCVVNWCELLTVSQCFVNIDCTGWDISDEWKMEKRLDILFTENLLRFKMLLSWCGQGYIKELNIDLNKWDELSMDHYRWKNCLQAALKSIISSLNDKRKRQKKTMKTVNIKITSKVYNDIVTNYLDSKSLVLVI